MGEIRVGLEIRGINSTVTIPALVDTGAKSDFIRRTLDSGASVDSIGISAFRGKKAVWLADQSRVDGDLVEFPSVRLLKRTVHRAPFVVFADLREEAIIGHLTMQSLDLQLRPHARLAWPTAM